MPYNTPFRGFDIPLPLPVTRAQKNIVIAVRDNNTCEPLPGVAVQLYNNDNISLGRQVTGPSGRTVFPLIHDGIFIITAIAPPGYSPRVLSADRFLYLSEGCQHTFSFVYTGELTSIVVNFRDGAVPSRTITDGSVELFIAGRDYARNINKNGFAVFSGTPEGNFVIREKNAPDGYRGESTPYYGTLRLGENIYVAKTYFPIV